MGRGVPDPCRRQSAPDVWTLKGEIGVPFALPVTLGCDGAGHAPDGSEVLLYPRLPGSAFRPLGDGIDGTFAAQVACPGGEPGAQAVEPRPGRVSGTWHGMADSVANAVREGRGQAGPSDCSSRAQAVACSTAAIMLANAAGVHVTVTSPPQGGPRSGCRPGRARDVETGQRLPQRVDVALETVGRLTWEHTLRSLGQNGRVVVAGATSGSQVDSDLMRVTVRELTISGSMLGTPAELRDLCAFVAENDIHPPISQVFDGLYRVPSALRALERAEHFGKLVVTI